MADQAAFARDYLVSLGYAPHQAAGMVGNLIQESGLRTNARNPGDGRDGTDSVGVGQWNGARARGLHNFAASRGMNVGDLRTQLAYVDHELKTTERRAYDRLMSSRDVPSATAAMISYERPAGFTWDNPTAGHGWSNRLKHAMALSGQSVGDVPSFGSMAAGGGSYSGGAPGTPSSGGQQAAFAPVSLDGEPQQSARAELIAKLLEQEPQQLAQALMPQQPPMFASPQATTLGEFLAAYNGAA